MKGLANNFGPFLVDYTSHFTQSPYFSRLFDALYHLFAATFPIPYIINLPLVILLSVSQMYVTFLSRAFSFQFSVHGYFLCLEFLSPDNCRAYCMLHSSVYKHAVISAEVILDHFCHSIPQLLIFLHCTYLS